MDGNKRPKMVTEDRLSGLPDELLHQIFSCFDTKYVVQTCLLSRRWRNLWRSMPCLTLSSPEFDSLPRFSKFVTKVLSGLRRRNRDHDQIGVWSIKLSFHGGNSQAFVKRIARYAFSHNVQQLMVCSGPNNHQQLPLCLFSGSKSLKHFTFRSIAFYSKLHTPKTPWDFPVLTTLYLSKIALFGDAASGDSVVVDLFSKCVNLKNLTLKNFHVCYAGAAVFDIITPRLENLILIDFQHPNDVVNVIAPRLKNLTAKDCKIKHLNAPPGIAYVKLSDQELLHLIAPRNVDVRIKENEQLTQRLMEMLPKALALGKKTDAVEEEEAELLARSIQACVGRLHDLNQEQYKNFEAIHLKEMQILTVLYKNLPTQDRAEDIYGLRVAQYNHDRLLLIVKDSYWLNRKIIHVFKQHEHHVSSSPHISTSFQDIARITEDWAKRFEFMLCQIKKGLLFISTLREDHGV